MNVKAVIYNCLNFSFEELRAFAARNYEKVYLYVQSKDSGEYARTMLIGTIFTCISLDGKLSDTEYDFIVQFVGDYSKARAFEEASSFYNDEAAQMVRRLLHAFPQEIKEAYVCMCLAVLSVDKRVNGDEIFFLEQLL